MELHILYVTRFLGNKDAIITTLALANAQLETLTQDEWKEIEEACEALRPFGEATVEISGERYVTILLEQ